ncbi:hypothetical protein PG991_010632 [Apiospora marii]|uniref:Uncharacterized protein n=1 Tax=Apiospora marii TaxID=335849 RepID=A0ABR1RBU7_9PEZI
MLASILEDLDPYLREVTGKVAYIWQTLGYSDKFALIDLETEFNSCITQTLKVLRQLQEKTEDTCKATNKLSRVLNRLVQAAKQAEDSIKEEKSKNGYVYPKKQRNLANFYRIFETSNPISVSEVEDIVQLLTKTREYNHKAKVAMESIHKILENARTELEQAYNHAGRGFGIPWQARTKMLRSRLRIWRKKSQEHLVVLEGIQKQYRTNADRPRIPNRSTPEFSFPLLNIQGNKNATSDFTEMYDTDRLSDMLSEKEDM